MFCNILRPQQIILCCYFLCFTITQPIENSKGNTIYTILFFRFQLKLTKYIFPPHFPGLRWYRGVSPNFFICVFEQLWIFEIHISLIYLWTEFKAHLSNHVARFSMNKLSPTRIALTDHDVILACSSDKPPFFRSTSIDVFCNTCVLPPHCRIITVWYIYSM